MTDEEIMMLFRDKSTKAIIHTHDKYQTECTIIGNNILFSEALTKECLMKTYNELFEILNNYSFNNLKGILIKTMRKNVIEKYYELKRSEMGEYIFFLPIYELKAALSNIDKDKCREKSDNETILKALTHFITGLSSENKYLFIMRYFYMCDSTNYICNIDYRKKSTQRKLKRLLVKLKKYFKKNNIAVHSEEMLFELIGKLNDRLICEV